MNLRLKLTAAFALAATVTAFADIKVNDNVSISGYAAASYESFDLDPGPNWHSFFDGSKDSPSADALKAILTANFKPVTAVASVFYIPKIPKGVMKNEVTILDAYLTVDVGNGFTLTGGKFLSYLGYEAFDPVNMSQISYGAVTVGTLAAIPAYHSGGKIDYADKTVGYGFAVVDSVYSNKGIDRGDGEFGHNAGFEGYVTSKGLGDLTLWAGFAYDTKGNFQPHSVLTLDTWAQYAINKQLTVAGELCTKDGGDAATGWTWLLYSNYAFTDQFSTVFRVSGEQLDGTTKTLTGSQNFIQYTVGPSFKVNDHFTVRAEYSYYDYTRGVTKSLLGVQAVLKF